MTTMHSSRCAASHTRRKALRNRSLERRSSCVADRIRGVASPGQAATAAQHVASTARLAASAAWHAASAAWLAASADEKRGKELQ